MKRKHLWIVLLTLGTVLPLGLETCEPDLGTWPVGLPGLPNLTQFVTPLLTQLGLPALPTTPAGWLTWLQQVAARFTT